MSGASGADAAVRALGERARRGARIAAALALLLLAHGAASAADESPGDAEWRVAGIDVEGNDVVGAGEIRDVMLTEQRAWWAPWRARPIFDAVTLESDLERIRRLYETKGYYRTEVRSDLDFDREAEQVTILLSVEEGPPVVVEDVEIEVDGPDETIEGEMPLAAGDVFLEEAYQESEQALRVHFLDRGHARVQVTRRAEIDRDAGTARVVYGAQPGPSTLFGETRVEGLDDVDPEVVLRELAYEPGEAFAAEPLALSRDRILALDLFRSVRVTPQLDGPEPTVIPILIEVEEKPPRSIRVGAGYGTFEGVRGQIEWRHPNWLGGGRQLSASLKASQITLGADLSFVQPYLFGRRAERGIVSGRIFQDDWETYTLASTQLLPRIEHRFSDDLVGFFGWRVDYDDVSEVDTETIDAIGGFIDKGLLSAPQAGLAWTTADDLLDPTRGHSVALDVTQGGAIWGGAWDYWRAGLDLRKYLAVGWRTVLAGRVNLGLADAIGSVGHLPIFERFYAGGQNSVRGYGLRRLGPLSTSDRPLGGRSLLEGSLEARRPIWGSLGGAVFLDFGQVSLDAYDPPVDDLQLATGFGVTYGTPIGPLRLDVGFPFDPPADDAPWQLHFSIGHFF